MEKPNWRHSHQLTIEAELLELKRQRDLGHDRSLFVVGWEDSVRLAQADDDELLEFAQREAEKITNEAIARWNETHD